MNDIDPETTRYIANIHAANAALFARIHRFQDRQKVFNLVIAFGFCCVALAFILIVRRLP